VPNRERQAKLIEAAVEYAGRGLPVFPCNGKLPRTEHGFQDASTDTEAVLAWWTRWPEANIGIPTGAASGLVVLDVDVQHGGAGALAELERKHGKLPRAPEVLTGGGGKHLYFAHPGREVRNSAGKLGPGLDVRADGGYVIAPPSLHPSGRPYRWLRGEGKLELPAPPAWLLEDARRRQNGAAPPVEESIPEGKRRQELLSLAGTLRRRGLGADEILASLATVNEKRCRPPLTQAELEALAEDVASRYEPAKNSFPPLGRRTGGNENVSDSFVFSATPIESLLENVPPEPDWKFCGYVATYALTLLAGRPKVGKSTLVFALLAQLVAGERFAGIETAPAGVLLLTEERRDTLAEKARILGLVSFPPLLLPNGGNELRRPMHVLMRHDAGAVAWPELVRQAMTYCHQHELGVLVVDTWDRWTNLRGDAENAAGAVNEALEPLQYAAASGLAVLIVTHQRKSAGEFGDAVRGSNALTGGVDVVVELERPLASFSLGPHARVLRAVSRFSSTPDELFLELDDVNNGFAAIESPEQVKAASERLRVAEAASGSTSKEIAEAVELPAATVRRHLNFLLEAGYVERSGSGKRGDGFRWTRTEAE
jgi:hypothetical protein